MNNTVNVRWDCYCNEKNFEEYSLYCDAIDLCIKKMDCLIPVFEKFDGKVINKRLDKALELAMQEAIPEKSVYGYSCTLDCDFEPSRISITVNLWNLLQNMNPSYRSVNILHKYESYPTYDNEKQKLYHSKETSPFYFYLDDNYNYRLISQKAIECLSEGKKRLKEKVAELKKWTPEAYKEHILKMAELKKQFKTLEDMLPYQTKDLLHSDDLLRYI